MSRYLILLVLTAPFIIAGFLNALVAFKMKRSSRRQFLFRSMAWILIFIGVLLAEPIYQFLFSNNLTQTEPLSLFDVMQITGIVFVFFLASRSRVKIESLERRVNDLHQELSIRLSEEE